MTKSERRDRCATCGRRRGLEEQRQSWSLQHPVVFVPRTTDPEERPWQQANDLICSAGIYRNGGTSADCHLCNECLRVGLRSLKVAICELLDELDAGHEKDEEIAELTLRLAGLQLRYSNLAHDHDRMQSRLAELLPHVKKSAGREAIHYAEWEATRGPAPRYPESSNERSGGQS